MRTPKFSDGQRVRLLAISEESITEEIGTTAVTKIVDEIVKRKQREAVELLQESLRALLGL